MPSFVNLPYFYPLAVVLVLGTMGIAASAFELWRGSRPASEPLPSRAGTLGGRR